MMRARTAFPLAIFALVSCANPAFGQSGLMVLSLPQREHSSCRVADSSETAKLPKKSVVREFSFGPETGIEGMAPREVLAAFDSVGHPLLLHDQTSAATKTEYVWAAFKPHGDLQGQRGRSLVDSAAAAAAASRGDPKGIDAAIRAEPMRALTSDEEVQVRDLLTWLWRQRCDDRKGS